MVDELKCVRDHRNEIESLTSTSAAGSAKYFVIVDGFSGIRKNVIGYSSTINVRNKFGASPPIQEDVTVTHYEKTGLLVSKSNFLLLMGAGVKNYKKSDAISCSSVGAKFADILLFEVAVNLKSFGDKKLVLVLPFSQFFFALHQ